MLIPICATGFDKVSGTIHSIILFSLFLILKSSEDTLISLSSAPQYFINKLIFKSLSASEISSVLIF